MYYCDCLYWFVTRCFDKKKRFLIIQMEPFLTRDFSSKDDAIYKDVVDSLLVFKIFNKNVSMMSQNMDVIVFLADCLSFRALDSVQRIKFTRITVDWFPRWNVGTMFDPLSYINVEIRVCYGWISQTLLRVISPLSFLKDHIQIFLNDMYVWYLYFILGIFIETKHVD